VILTGSVVPRGTMRPMAAIPQSTRDSISVLRDGSRIPLCRLRYGGSAHSFGFAIYSAAHDRYQEAVLRTGLPVGTPQEALDTACTVHLTGLDHEPGP